MANALAASAALVLCSAVPAGAEVGGPGTPTVQAVAAEATWLAYAPPPAVPGVVCLVDSGVDPNPDTNAAVVGGQAIAPETGTTDEIARLEPRVQPGNHPDGHGTLMAMTMAAPRNGWGMVGIAPTAVRVYNMKALPAGETEFPFSYYAVAIKDCERLRTDAVPAVSVASLSLGGSQLPTETELARLANYVGAAHHQALDVVAAAGNESGAVLYPAAYAGILAVGAGDASAPPGSLCAFASRGEGLDLVAPGCDGAIGGLEAAFADDGSPALGSGSSQASAIVSAVLAAMRAYAPSLTWEVAEHCLMESAVNGSLAAARAFDACGLGGVVAEGMAAERAAIVSGDPAPAGPGAESPPSAEPSTTVAPHHSTPKWVGGRHHIAQASCHGRHAARHVVRDTSSGRMRHGAHRRRCRVRRASPRLGRPR
ncbi:MAG: S8 family peptidase [Solirubrobacteraceae bacterium]